jgi:hypothetical protein
VVVPPAVTAPKFRSLKQYIVDKVDVTNSYGMRSISSFVANKHLEYKCLFFSALAVISFLSAALYFSLLESLFLNDIE